MNRWLIVALALVGAGLAATVVSTTRGAPVDLAQQPDTVRVPGLHVTVIDADPVVVGSRTFGAGEGSEEMAPIKYRSATRSALEIDDSREDFDRDGRFLCLMEHDATPEGALLRVDIISNSKMTRCMGVYERMPMVTDSTVECVRCPYSARQVCGSRPECME